MLSKKAILALLTPSVVMAIGSSVIAQNDVANPSVEVSIEGAFTSMAISQDDKVLVAGALQNDKPTLIAWDLPSGKQRFLQKELNRATITCLCVNPNARSIASIDFDGSLDFWDIEQGKRIISVKEKVNHGVAASFVSSKGALLTRGIEEYPVFWRVDDLNNVRRFADQPFKELKAIGAFTISRDDSKIAVSTGLLNQRNEVFVFDTKSGKKTITLHVPNNVINRLALSADGKALAAGFLYSGRDHDMINVWSTVEGRISASFEYNKAVMSLALSPDGKLLAAGDNAGNLTVWDLETKQVIREIPAHSQQLSWLFVTGDGRLIVSGSMEGTFKIWDVKTLRAGRK